MKMNNEQTVIYAIVVILCSLLRVGGWKVNTNRK